MRFLIGWLVVGAVLASEAPLPASSQKLIDDAVANTTKLHDNYKQAVGKEQGRLVNALQKEQDKLTKKGDLQGSLAIKAAIEQVQAGLLEQQAAASQDLLGDGPQPVAIKATPGEQMPANLTTTCQLSTRAASANEVPSQFAQFVTRSSMLTIPKGDPVRYAFTCKNAGLVLACTGPAEHAHADIWRALQQAGFTRVDTTDRGAWFVLDATAGAQFTVFDTSAAVMNLTLFAGQIRAAR
jgi:hypothetical protein